MAESWQITCINKTTNPDAYERIGRVGGPEGEGWSLRVGEVVSLIKKGDNFWVDVGGRRVDVIIADHSGHECIKTRIDGDSPDNLLSLPECVD